MKKIKFQRQKNLLKDLILKESEKEYSKQTIKGLFRSILESVIYDSSQGALVLMKVQNCGNISSLLKRLQFSQAKIYSYNDDLGDDFQNIEKKNCWEDTEFIFVLAPRFSVFLLWDYTLGAVDDFAPVYILYNSKFISDYAKIIFDNSTIDLSQYLTDFAPDRRENELLNVSINKICDIVNTLNAEIRVSEAERETLSITENKLQEYEYTSDKAKIVAHEIKNNLSIIDLYSKIIEKRLASIEIDKSSEMSIENAVKSIKNAQYSISQYINELKSFAKPILVERRLSSIIPQAVELALPKAKEKNIRLEYFIKNDYKVHIDEVKIQSVLINLIYNSIEAMNSGGEIFVVVEDKIGNMASIVVKDNAAGIKEEILDKIFEFGFTTKIEGNGLGLYICKSLIEEQYGQIQLKKSDDKGSEFEILIPII